MAQLVKGDGTGPDPRGAGAVYVSDGFWKRYVNDPGALPGYEAWLGPIKTVPQGALNEVPEVTVITARALSLA